MECGGVEVALDSSNRVEGVEEFPGLAGHPGEEDAGVRILALDRVM